MANIIKLKKQINSPFNTIKWVALFVLFFLALAANYHYPHLANSLRLLFWFIASLVFLAVFLSTTQGKRFHTFAKAAHNEMRKVVWPTRPETIQSTIAVVVLVAVLAFLLWLIDSLWLWLVTLITG